MRNVGLQGAPDPIIWEHAREHGYVIVSKDDDFRQRSLVQGSPPKVVWLQVGNAGTQSVANLLRHHRQRLRDFADEEESARREITAALRQLPLMPFMVACAIDPAAPESVLRLGDDFGAFGRGVRVMPVDVIDIDLHDKLS